MNPKVLIVEDEPDELEHLGLALEKIPSEHKELNSIERFDVTKTGTVSEAMQVLELAASQLKPFDLLVLDLVLPQNHGGIHSPEGGFSIMQQAVSYGSAREIIVCSAFSSYESALRAFRGGAVDFISKPYTTVEFQQHILTAWQRGLVKQSSQVFDRRLKTLIPYAGKGFALRFSACFSNLVESIAPRIQEMQAGLGQPGTKSWDSFANSLTIIEDALGHAKNDWTKLQASLGVAIETVGPVVIEKLLEAAVTELLPCLAVKRIRVRLPTDESTCILAFGDDVRVVLTEIIAGALIEVPDHPELGGTFEITIDTRGERAHVHFHDQMAMMSAKAVQTINSGDLAVPDRDYGREWGLSVAQHVALSGGGRILIEPVKKGGNTITYALPIGWHEPRPIQNPQIDRMEPPSPER